MLEFDPKKVGEVELGWWRAHNDKNKHLMFDLLVKQHQELYGLSPLEAQIAIKSLASGIQYHDIRDWDGARKAAGEYYQAIKNKTGLGFDPFRMGELEVSWWVTHDELENIPDKSKLAKAFALLYATQFGIDIDLLRNASSLKAEATREHDLAEAPGMSEYAEDHWSKTGQLLIEFYSELRRVISH